MTQSRTQTSTFNITHARYVTSKLMADLKLLQGAYDAPSDADIAAYGEEAALLLRSGLLGDVTFGFRRDGNWILALRYGARTDGTLEADDRAGRVPRGVDVNRASFYSYLTYSAAWDRLDWQHQQEIKRSLPVNRTAAPAPGTARGHWTSDKVYSSNGSGLGRRSFRAT